MPRHIPVITVEHAADGCTFMFAIGPDGLARVTRLRPCASGQHPPGHFGAFDGPVAGSSRETGPEGGSPAKGRF